MPADTPIQNFYNPETAICYGCGINNPDGMHFQTFWNGEEGVCHFRPDPKHTAFPNVVYGGILASVIDCHSIGTAIAAMYDLEGRPYGSEPEITCVTGNLNVSYLKPTPMGIELVIRTRVKEITPRKIIVTSSIFAGDVETVKGEVVAVRVSARMVKDDNTL